MLASRRRQLTTSIEALEREDAALTKRIKDAEAELAVERQRGQAVRFLRNAQATVRGPAVRSTPELLGMEAAALQKETAKIKKVATAKEAELRATRDRLAKAQEKLEALPEAYAMDEVEIDDRVVSIECDGFDRERRSLNESTAVVEAATKLELEIRALKIDLRGLQADTIAADARAHDWHAKLQAERARIAPIRRHIANLRSQAIEMGKKHPDALLDALVGPGGHLDVDSMTNILALVFDQPSFQRALDDDKENNREKTFRRLFHDLCLNSPAPEDDVGNNVISTDDGASTHPLHHDDDERKDDEIILPDDDETIEDYGPDDNFHGEDNDVDEHEDDEILLPDEENVDEHDDDEVLLPDEENDDVEEDNDVDNDDSDDEVDNNNSDDNNEEDELLLGLEPTAAAIFDHGDDSVVDDDDDYDDDYDDIDEDELLGRGLDLDSSVFDA